MLILLLMVIVRSEVRRDGALRHNRLGLALVICALVFLAGLSSCGGGGTSGGGGGGGGNPVTVQVPVQASAGGTTVTLGSLSITVP
jgi:hypothetical protein